MKKVIILFIVSCVITSCGNNGANQSALIQATKTADSLQAAMEQKNTVDSMNAVNNAQAHPGVNNEIPAQVARHEEHHDHNRGDHDRGDHNNNNGYNNNNGGAPVVVQPTPVVVNQPAPVPTAVQANNNVQPAPGKPGWSDKAKGAVIGAGAGAVAGALIDSKKKGQAVKGGIIGGVIGAAAGLGAGAIMDHKKKKNDTTAH